MHKMCDAGSDGYDEDPYDNSEVFKIMNELVKSSE